MLPLEVSVSGVFVVVELASTASSADSTDTAIHSDKFYIYFIEGNQFRSVLYSMNNTANQHFLYFAMLYVQ